MEDCKGIQYPRYMKQPPLVPRPRQANVAQDCIALGRLKIRAAGNPILAKGVERTNKWLGGHNDRLSQAGAGPTVPLRIDLADYSERTPALGDDESYQLRIAADGVLIRAPGTAGALHALATLAQLSDGNGHLPSVRIEDAPCFPWRGLMLDPARRFISLNTLLNTLDAMAFYKLNVLHLHLTDDQGFRFQSQAYPKLASHQSYSPEQLRVLVAAAGERAIRVVPELDMPGHVTSWLCAHPEWGPQPAEVSPSRQFGPHEAVLNPADEAVYQAIDTLFGEFAELFPDAFIHIGGDEVNPAWWNDSAEISAYRSERNLRTLGTLQSRFLERIAELAARRGKRVLGWDEVLTGGAPTNLVVQSWRGATARGRALATGHDCVVSSGYYLDLFYPADVHHRYAPDAAEGELLAQEDALPNDPRFSHVAAGLKWAEGWRLAASEAGSGKVLGGEACLWSELVTDELLPVRLWSRMPVLADRFWSNRTAPENLAAWLESSLEQLAAAGIFDLPATSRKLLVAFGVDERQIPGVELLEPIKWYGRLLGSAALLARVNSKEEPKARPYHADTPLNRPVDALPPESFAANRFRAALAQGGDTLLNECVKRLSACEAGTFPPELEAPMWALAATLRALLTYLRGNIDAATARALLAKASEPQGEYLVAIAPSVQEWLAGQ